MEPEPNLTDFVCQQLADHHKLKTESRFGPIMLGTCTTCKEYWINEAERGECQILGMLPELEFPEENHLYTCNKFKRVEYDDVINSDVRRYK
jgi:hypothetical protein